MNKIATFLAVLMISTAARAGTLYRFLSDYCTGRDSVCLTNTIASIGTNLMTLVVDGGPWSISNTVVIPSNIELIYSRDSLVTLVGTNTIIENTARIRQDWLTNLNVEGSVNVTGPVAVVGDVTVTGGVTAASFTGDGSGLSNVAIIGTIDYQIDGTTNIVAGTITSPSFANSAVGNAALADGAVTALKISAGVVSTSALSASGVSAGEYTSAWIRVDANGRISAASNGAAAGAGIVTQNLSSVLTVGNDGTGQSMTNMGSATFTNAVTAKTLTASGVGSAIIGNGNGVTNVSGTNIVNNTVGAAALQATAVSAGTYTAPTIAVDADGRITSAASHALNVTDTISGSGSAGYTQIGACGATNSVAFGPFSGGVGVFTLWIFQSGTGQFQYQVKYADDSGMSVNLVTMGTMGDNPDVGADHNQTCTFLIPKNKYVKVYCTTAGSSGYYVRYGILEL